MIVLVTGGRKFKDRKYIWAILTHLHNEYGFDLLVNGKAEGVDTICQQWALANGVQPCEFQAMWDAEDTAAGPKRNRRMYDYMKPDMVVVFPGNTGTNDMIKYVSQKRKQGHEFKIVFTEDILLDSGNESV